MVGMQAESLAGDVMEIKSPCGAVFVLDDDEQALLRAIRDGYTKELREWPDIGDWSASINRDMLDFFSHIRFRRVLEAVTGYRDVWEWEDLELSAEIYDGGGDAGDGGGMVLTPEGAAKVAEIKKLAELGDD